MESRDPDLRRRRNIGTLGRQFNPGPRQVTKISMEINSKDRILSALAYLFGIPALYIILTANRKREYVSQHGVRAFIIWVLFFVLFFSLRSFINLIWGWYYWPPLSFLEVVLGVAMLFYILYRAGRAMAGRT
ncbi:MAG: hypothetical protein PHH60_03515 [Candidatus Margulisbacteria bacterium]|nr:hypothetical protein [Candidatus Margulisiibacteriota bacterium]